MPVIVAITPPEDDRKYRILVMLQRSDRPKYFLFHCQYCGRPVCELVNSEVYAVSDAMDMNNTDLVAVGIRCGGRLNGFACQTYYYFRLS